jgi:NAD(P)-dependent dehydrogenase (short-subunit alcohol dehydrogenase family)
MQEIIWVTGASTGIGRELCIKLARDGHRVIASARNQAALDELAAQHSGIEALAVDVTEADAAATLAEQLSAIVPYLDRVIVNAGRCEYLRFPKPDWQMVDRVMAVNLHGASRTVAAALPLLRARPAERNGNAHIVGVVSQVIFAPFARAEAYGASKAALAYLLDSLRIDLQPENIDVTAIHPGFVTTPMTAQNDFPMPFVMSAERAVARMVPAIWRRPRHYAFPKRLSALLFISKLIPKLWDRAMLPAEQRQANNSKD